MRRDFEQILFIVCVCLHCQCICVNSFTLFFVASCVVHVYFYFVHTNKKNIKKKNNKIIYTILFRLNFIEWSRFNQSGCVYSCSYNSERLRFISFKLSSIQFNSKKKKTEKYKKDFVYYRTCTKLVNWLWLLFFFIQSNDTIESDNNSFIELKSELFNPRPADLKLIR